MLRPTVLFFSCFPFLAIAGLFGSSTYDECVLDSMKGVTSDQAARAIIVSCRNKFPTAKAKAEDMPPWELAKITGKGRVSPFTDSFTANLYNGSNEWTVTEVTVVLTATDEKGKVQQAMEYAVDLNLPPLATQEIAVSILKERDVSYQWNISKARGQKLKK